MEAVIERKQTAFRLATDLLERLKVLAKKDNRSLNNYVESVLMEIAYREPNAETKAIKTSDNLFKKFLIVFTLYNPLV